MKPRLIIYCLVALILTGCTKESVKSMYDKQETNIENFVNAQTRSNEDAYVVYNGGSVRVVTTPGDGEEELAKDGTVSFYYAGYILSGTSVSISNLFATNREDLSTSWTLSDESSFEPLVVKLDEADMVEGLKKGLQGVKTGEECYILFSGKYGFGDKPYGTIPANAALVYRIWVNSIENN